MMSRYEIDIIQTVTYKHAVIVDCEEDDIEDIMDRLSRVEQLNYGEFTEFIPEIEGSGDVTITDTIEDGSGDCEWKFDYDEV